MNIQDILKRTNEDFVRNGQGKALLERLNKTFAEYGISIDDQIPLISMFLKYNSIQYDVNCAKNSFSFLVSSEYFSQEHWGNVKELAGSKLQTQEEFNTWLKRLLDENAQNWSSTTELQTAPIDLTAICPEKITKTESNIYIINSQQNNSITKSIGVTKDYLSSKDYRNPKANAAYKQFIEEFLSNQHDVFVGEDANATNFMKSVAASTPQSLDKWESQMNAFLIKWQAENDKEGRSAEREIDSI